MLVVDTHREIEGCRIGVQLAASEETADGLIGDEGFRTLHILKTCNVVDLESVGLDDGLSISMDGDVLVLSAPLGYRDGFGSHQQVVGGIDDRTLGLFRVVARKTAEYGALGSGDVAGEGLEGVDVTFVANLGVFGAEVVSHQTVGARWRADRSTGARDEFGIAQPAVVGGIEEYLHVFGHLDGSLNIYIHIYVEVDIHV